MNSYPLGSSLYIYADVYVTNPATKRFVSADSTLTLVIEGGGVRTTITSVTRLSTGHYYAAFTPTALGIHTYGWTGTGDVTVVSQDYQFTIVPRVTAL